MFGMRAGGKSRLGRMLITSRLDGIRREISTLSTMGIGNSEP